MQSIGGGEGDFVVFLLSAKKKKKLLKDAQRGTSTHTTGNS